MKNRLYLIDRVTGNVTDYPIENTESIVNYIISHDYSDALSCMYAVTTLDRIAETEKVSMIIKYDNFSQIAYTNLSWRQACFLLEHTNSTDEVLVFKDDDGLASFQVISSIQSGTFVDDVEYLLRNM